MAGTALAGVARGLAIRAARSRRGRRLAVVAVAAAVAAVVAPLAAVVLLVAVVVTAVTGVADTDTMQVADGGAVAYSTDGSTFVDTDPDGNAWGGYANGQIPTSELCPLPSAPHHRARCDAAEAFGDLTAAFRDQFGHDIGVTDAYRSYADQVATKIAKGTLAATPGYSNHGWGLAFDLGSGINDDDSPQYAWMKDTGYRFGFFHPTWAEPDSPDFAKAEPWHWQYVPAATEAAARVSSAGDGRVVVGRDPGRQPRPRARARSRARLDRPRVGVPGEAVDGRVGLEPPRGQPDLECVRHPAGAARFEDGDRWPRLAQQPGDADSLGFALHRRPLRHPVRGLVVLEQPHPALVLTSEDAMNQEQGRRRISPRLYGLGALVTAVAVVGTAGWFALHGWSDGGTPGHAEAAPGVSARPSNSEPTSAPAPSTLHEVVEHHEERADQRAADAGDAGRPAGDDHAVSNDDGAGDVSDEDVAVARGWLTSALAWREGEAAIGPWDRAVERANAEWAREDVQVTVVPATALEAIATDAAVHGASPHIVEVVDETNPEWAAHGEVTLRAAVVFGSSEGWTRPGLRILAGIQVADGEVVAVFIDDGYVVSDPELLP